MYAVDSLSPPPTENGQVVIPEDVRKRLILKVGTQFVAVGDSDVVILKAIAPLSMDEFVGLVAKARRQAKTVGLNKSDIVRAIAEVCGGNDSQGIDKSQLDWQKILGDSLSRAVRL